MFFCAVNDINVENGTAVDSIGLPEEVEVTLSDDSKVNVPVEWDTSNYDGNTAGTYTLTGTLDVSGLDNVTNPNNLTASVNVIVAEAELAVESVSAIDIDEIAVCIGLVVWPVLISVSEGQF